MNKISLSEKVIEDIFVLDKSIISEILKVSYSEISLLARQKTVNSGILDLLYLQKDVLLLIELKIVPFYNDAITQINDYYKDLLQLQNEKKLIQTTIHRIILVTHAKEADYNLCKKENISLIEYNPKEVLTKYYENFKALSYFLTIQSGDFGVVRLGLLCSTLKYLSEGKSKSEIAIASKRSVKSIGNRLSVATHLNLVNKFRNGYYLTEIGIKFVENISNTDEHLSENQIRIIASFIKENPFFSTITYTIFSVIETVFVLSKNIYPVPRDLVKDYFVKSVGKTSTWRTPKARETATYIFTNYACELNFLAKVDSEFFITPEGIQAILLLQLNRSIKLIENK
jgi:hypothetical protein